MNPYFEALASEYPEFTLARVISQEKGIYRITYGGSDPVGIGKNLYGRLR